jgi:hypothetical protein
VRHDKAAPRRKHSKFGHHVVDQRFLRSREQIMAALEHGRGRTIRLSPLGEAHLGVAATGLVSIQEVSGHQCLLWVKSRHVRRTSPCLPIADSCNAANSPHKHLVGEHEQCRWGAQRGRDGAISTLGSVQLRALTHSILTVSAIPGQLLRRLSARPSPAPSCATGP